MAEATFAVQVTLTRQEDGHTSQATITEQGKDLERVVKEAKVGLDSWALRQK
ncbi:MAG TPA: hypothetical protein VGS01_09465 [Candidatus Limnocylindria bacterium]|jgi:hypothetical protein|nr:hypothetical protein [Candidatus Limnocylindria bacterium]